MNLGTNWLVRTVACASLGTMVLLGGCSLHAGPDEGGPDIGGEMYFSTVPISTSVTELASAGDEVRTTLTTTAAEHDRWVYFIYRVYEFSASSDPGSDVHAREEVDACFVKPLPTPTNSQTPDSNIYQWIFRVQLPAQDAELAHTLATKSTLPKGTVYRVTVSAYVRTGSDPYEEMSGGGTGLISGDFPHSSGGTQ